MNETPDDAPPTHDTPDETAHSPDGAAVSPEDCDVDLSDRDTFQAVWLEFQRERGARCAATGTPLELALAEDAGGERGGPAEVMVACPACGQRVQAAPPDAPEVFGWAE